MNLSFRARKIIEEELSTFVVGVDLFFAQLNERRKRREKSRQTILFEEKKIIAMKTILVEHLNRENEERREKRDEMLLGSVVGSIEI